MQLTAASNKAASRRQLGFRVACVYRASLSRPCSPRDACAIALSHVAAGRDAAIAQLCVDGAVRTSLIAAQATYPVGVLEAFKASAENARRELAQNLHLVLGQNGQSLCNDLVP